MPGKVRIHDLLSAKQQRRKIAMLTAYDYPLAKLLDAAGVDVILIGDSLGMVVLGYETTAGVTMEEMLHHAKAVRRAVTRALVVGDMPLVAIRGTPEEALHHARRFAEEAGCEAVKVEWREGIGDAVRSIVEHGIPVIGHVGLTPQTAQGEGGFGYRGKDAATALRLVRQADALAEQGCCAMVLECLPEEVAAEITRRLPVPTIGIGSGPRCDGQVLVTYDVLGLFDRFTPKFVKQYVDLSQAIDHAAGAYVQEVRAGAFPGPSQTVRMAPEELAKLRAELGTT